jgi:hypothetical protein
MEENILNRYACDVFLHTWDFVGHKAQHPTTDEERQAFEQHSNYHVYDYDNKITISRNEFATTYRMTATHIEEYYPMFYNRFYHETLGIELTRRHRYMFDPGSYNTRGRTHMGYMSLLSMWYARWKCFTLMETYAREHGIVYDYCIVGRPDKSVTIELHRVPQGVLLVPELRSHLRHDVHDTHAAGPTALIREYCHLYPRFDILRLGLEIENITYSGILYQYLTRTQVPFEMVPPHNEYHFTCRNHHE